MLWGSTRNTKKRTPDESKVGAVAKWGGRGVQTTLKKEREVVTKNTIREGSQNIS